MTEREALKLALALVLKAKKYADECSHMATQADVDEFDTVATAIKEALAQPEQEPVAWRFQSAVGGWAYGKEPPIGSKYAVEPLYATPPQRIWVGLTDEEMFKTWLTVPAETEDRLAFGRAVEAKLKQKNAL